MIQTAPGCVGHSLSLPVTAAAAARPRPARLSLRLPVCGSRGRPGG